MLWKLALISLPLVGLMAFRSAYAASTFAITTVDSRHTSGQTISLAIDQIGEPRIAYHFKASSAGADGDLYYAYHQSGAWFTEPIDTAGDVGLTASLVLGASDQPHVAYPDFTLNALKYATRVNGAWQIEVVDQPPNGTFVQGWASIALDSNGDPHIAYYVNNVPLFRYASRHAGVWTVETIGFLESAQWLSLKLDGADVPHISYWDVRNHVKYATKNSGSWAFETIDVAGSFSPAETSLGLDGEGKPWVAYFRPSSPSDGDLALAMRDGLGWHVELVDTAGSTGYKPSLHLAAVGGPSVSYFDIDHGALRYASKASPPWSLAVVDAQQNAGENSSLGLGPDGAAWIAYFATDAANQNGQLKVAHEEFTDAVPADPSRFALDGISPNPAPGGRMTVRFTLPNDAPATIELLDVTGRRVDRRTLSGQAGRQSVDLGDATRIPPGLYWVRLRHGGREGAIRAVVLQ